MRTLGEQWVEVIDGKEHMVKAVEGSDCKGCHYGKMYENQRSMNNLHICDREDKCPFNQDNLIVKDLGILKDGFLPEERTGLYPTHEHAYILGATGNSHIIGVKTEHEHVHVCDSSYGRCKERWNRRA